MNMRRDGVYGLLIGAMTLLCLSATGCTKEERADALVSETVKAFCLQWFPDERIIASERSGDGVQVTLCGGTVAAFDEADNWTRIENRERAVPSGIVAGTIEEYLAEHYPDSRILLLEHDEEYHVGLDAGVRVSFDETFRVTVQPWLTETGLPTF